MIGHCVRDVGTVAYIHRAGEGRACTRANAALFLLSAADMGARTSRQLVACTPAHGATVLVRVRLSYDDGTASSSDGLGPQPHGHCARDSLATSQHGSGENRLLAALPPRGRRHFLASCDPVELGFGDVLCKLGEPIRYVYFPTKSFISLVTALEDGARLEVGIVGDEGMLGTSLILGVSTSPQHAVVQGAGAAWRMSAPTFQRHYRQNAELRRRLNRYVYILMRQLAQTAACTHYHIVEARLARWLLMTRDRAYRDQFHLTHEFLSYMLGVRRVGVTEAASSLQKQGLIDYRRGSVTILDDAGLEEASCRCYRAGNEMYERTLGSSRPARRSHRAPGRERAAVSVG